MIENSPFHISKTNVLNNKEPSIANKNVKEAINNKKITEDKSSFWDWFRGLVNPLQNLPIVSGIYSSINSEDTDSDRDVVQSSLGGFMYGGPIGAIAGFGNWVFNKIFDKTPTEMAFDFTGISNLWKDDKEKVVAKGNKNESQNLQEYVVKNNIGEWWKNDRQDLVRLQEKPNLKNKVNVVEAKTSAQKLNDSKVISLISNKYQEPEKLTNNVINQKDKLLQKQKIIDLDSKLVELPVKKTALKSEIKELNQKDQFREINFNYPEWKPNEIEIKEKADRSILQKRYLDIPNHDELGSKINMKL